MWIKKFEKSLSTVSTFKPKNAFVDNVDNKS